MKNGGRPAGVHHPAGVDHKTNYKQLFNGYLKKSKVCVGVYKKYCT